MSKHRESALVLHGLSTPDQDWIMTRLGTDDQRILSEHLVELKNLGIPADRTLIDVSTSAAKASRRRAAADPLDMASCAQVQAMLANEPVWLIRQVLALDDFSWRQEYLDAQTSALRERLTARPPAIPSKLAECLRKKLQQRLTSSDTGHAMKKKPSPKDRLLDSVERVRKWL